MEPAIDMSLTFLLIRLRVGIGVVENSDTGPMVLQRREEDFYGTPDRVVVPLPGEGQSFPWLNNDIVSAQVPVHTGPGHMIGAARVWIRLDFFRPPESQQIWFDPV